MTKADISHHNHIYAQKAGKIITCPAKQPTSNQTIQNKPLGKQKTKNPHKKGKQSGVLTLC